MGSSAGKATCSLYASDDVEDEDGSAGEGGPVQMPARAAVEDHGFVARGDRPEGLQKNLDLLFETYAKNLNMSNKMLDVVSDQKLITERNISAEASIIDDLKTTKSMLTVMQRGLFNFTGSTRKKNDDFPALPKFAKENVQTEQKPYSCDLSGIMMIQEDCEDSSRMNFTPTALRFAGSFCWVLEPDMDSFRGTIPYMMVTKIMIDGEKKVNITLVKAGKETVVRLGAEGKPVDGKPPVIRYFAKDAKGDRECRQLCAVEDICREFIKSAAVMGNVLQIEYELGVPDAWKFGGQGDLDSSVDGKKSFAQNMADTQDMLAKTREELENAEDGLEVITKVLESSGAVLETMLDLSLIHI
eukprot:TRINITY_DN18965_c0_g1_i4.p2 TRINITY_DN18965_c0_g1~~TRINITY_DN18965_c0_g1_i4.p2  ORF type:complete len:357 (+),score=112.55 TRINITY_DN18965_c0_g1_i4:61-1131(+)